MARIRTIKPSMFSSLTVCAWPIDVRWTFAGLFTYLDDYGRGLDEPRLIKAEIYPLDDKMTVRKIISQLELFVASGPLCCYAVEGHDYMHITSWSEHQRVAHPTASRIPPCPIHDKDGEIPE